jgi:hypothetical protein
MLIRLDITRKLLSQLPEQDRVSENQALGNWWRDVRNETCLRLSAEGYSVFKTLGISGYNFEIPPGVPSRASILLILSRKLTCPYYIHIGKTPSLILFGSQEATMYSLYGDINRFVTALNRS